MTEKELEEMARVKRYHGIVRDLEQVRKTYKISRPLTDKERIVLMRYLMRLRGDPPTIPDLYVLYRLTMRGLFPLYAGKQALPD